MENKKGEDFFFFFFDVQEMFDFMKKGVGEGMRG